MATKKNELQQGAVAGGSSIPVETALAQYEEYFKKIGGMFYEREWEVQQLKLAILIGEHVLYKGTPGTAKSMLAMKVFNGIKGAEIYKNQFTRMQDDSYVFGPQLLDEFKAGRVVHNTKGTLITAHFGFLDEFFNASEETLVATLEPLNERTFTRPHQKEVCPLISAVMTTNQDRENEKELRAVYDRILFKSDVKAVVETKNRVAMYRDYLGGVAQVQPEIDFPVIQALRAYFQQYDPKVADSVLTVYDAIVAEYESQVNVAISPRKKNKMLNIVVASAFLRGGATIELGDLEQIKYAVVEGGDAKSLSYFDSVFKKVALLMQKAETLQKMEALYDANLKEPDASRQFKIAVGLEKKCEKMADELKNDASAMSLMPSLEALKKKASAFAKKLQEKVGDEDIF